MSGAASRVLVGLMSGTSADGIDAAVVRVHDAPGPAPAPGAPGAVTVLAHHHAEFPGNFRARLLALPDARPAELALLHVELGRRFAAAASAALALVGLAARDVAAIGSPGLTAVHLPPRPSAGGARGMADAVTATNTGTAAHSDADASTDADAVAQDEGATLALGDGDVIAARTGCTVVSDMRAADRAAGGHGAPLVPWANALLLRALPATGEPRVRGALNIGGIANITLVPSRGDPIAFDTGPGNMLLDAAVSRATGGAQAFDRDGALGLAGRVDEAWLDELLRTDEFLQQRPPRSAGRERYGAAWMARHGARLSGTPLPDAAATLAAYTAEAVVLALRDHVRAELLPRDLVVSGGGALNACLMARLRERLRGVRRPASRDGHAAGSDDIDVVTSEQALGIPVLAMEAVAFALIADATLRGVPSNVPSVTGASRPCVLGKLSRAPSRAPEPGA